MRLRNDRLFADDYKIIFMDLTSKIRGEIQNGSLGHENMYGEINWYYFSED